MMRVSPSHPTKTNQPIQSKLRLTAMGLCAIFFLGILGFNSSINNAIQEWLRLKGFYLSYFLDDPASYAQAVPVNILKSIGGGGELPVLALDIKFKNWKKLEQKRRKALTGGTLITSDDDYVRATLRYEDKAVRVKLRLKGDHLDHLMGNKWSFRIKVSGKDRIWGMRRFSIQNPRTRRFQSEPVFYEMLKDYGILTPRYFFVRTYVNGEDIGVMAIEEHFSKEMIEHNRRKESVFLRIDERGYFSHKQYKFQYDSNLKSFQHSTIWKSKELLEDYETAIGLVRSFLAGDLPAGRVFDEVLMGRFLALVDVWGAGHGLYFNTRMYYNPIIARLEPVGFDSNIGEETDFPGSQVLGISIKSSAMRLVYADTIRNLKSQFSDPSYIDKLDSIDAKFEAQLRGEFFLKPPPVKSLFESFRRRIKEIEESWSEEPIVIGSFDECDAKPFRGWAVDLRNPNDSAEFEYLSDNGTQRTIYANQSELGFHKLGLRELGIDSDKHGFTIPQRTKNLNLHCSYITNPQTDLLTLSDKPDYFALVDALIYVDNNHSVLEIINTTLHPINIHSVHRDGMPLKMPGYRMPILLHPDTNILISLQKTEDLPSLGGIVVASTIQGKNIEYLTNARIYAGPLSTNPVPDSDAKEQAELHSFLSLDEKSKTLNISTGTWHITAPIIVPAGYTLSIKKGTTLHFDPNCGIVSFGSLSFNGKLEDPILLDAVIPEKYWKGIVVLGKHEKVASHLHGVVIRNATNIEQGKWRQTGGVVFYRSNLEINDSRIENGNSEDAINIIQSRFDIRNLTIDNSTSDALDIDFSEGSISNSVFQNIGYAGGGDAIDVSGSKVILRDLVIRNVNDKALSAGERSQVSASNIKINNSSIGVASKDSSHVSISNSLITEIQVAGLMAYVKKQEYGPGSIKADNIVFSNTILEAKVQTGSRTLLNGVEITPENFGVEQLYKKLGKLEIAN